MAEYINKNDIKGTGIIFTGEDDVYTSAQADGADKMWNKILSLPTVNVIPIPEGATNGDMIKALFPGAVFTDSMVEGYVCSIECHLIGRDTKRMYFDVDWWNAPYKAEMESEE